jgi:hypothetical protein
MKSALLKGTLGTTAIAAVLLAASVIQAGGWDNFKLQYFHLTQVFQAQNRELGDLAQQNIDPSDHSRIDLDELLNGGPPKDGIPSIDDPRFDTAETTPFAEDELVIGLVVNGEARAYPFGIMNWHEIVNDTVGGVNVSVSYCPLCDTMLVVERGETTFGVSGKLYQSCLVMYDRADDTLYAQPWAMGIVGPNVNHNLTRLPVIRTTLGSWLEQHPGSLVLSTETGYNRTYSRYPYGTYYTDNNLVFPVRNQNQLEHHPKTIISYVWEASEATPHNQFAGASLQFVHADLEQQGEIEMQFGNAQDGTQRVIRARWDDTLETVVVEELDGTPIPSSSAFAFVYPAFFARLR